MLQEKANAINALSTGMVAGGMLSEQIKAPYFTFELECLDADGNAKWSDKFRNTVLTAGKNDLLDKYFSGSAYTASWFFGLIDSAGFTAIAAADTAASHAGWAESSAYVSATRPAVAFSAASAGAKAPSAAVAFSINATVTINGVFIVTNNVKGGTTGIIYSAGLISPTRSMINGDTLNVTGSWSV